MHPEPHRLLGPLVGLVGTWVGGGTGQLPGREMFGWRERLTIEQAGTPVLAFHQRTNRGDGTPFHAEDGWVRVPPELQTDGQEPVIEMVVASPTGVLEALSGGATSSADGCVLDASSTAIARTDAAGHVLDTRRRWTLDGDNLIIDFWMATPNDPELFHHLTSRLERAPEPQIDPTPSDTDDMIPPDTDLPTES